MNRPTTRRFALSWRLAAGCFALLLLSGVLRSDPTPFVPPLQTIEPIGSNPRASTMTAEEFEAYTAEWRERLGRFFETYSPDYTGGDDLLEPPREGRLAKPLPLARDGQAVAEIVVDLNPALHTPEATLGRADYPPEVAVMRHTGHVIVKNAVDELKHWLDTLTGADFPVVQAPTRGRRTRIHVGTHFARPRFAADLARLGEGEALDGFAVRARGNDIYIFGATTKGTLNGVYAFLENNSDLIWAHSVSDLGTVYTVNPDLNVVWADALEIPGTIQRGWLAHYRERDGVPEPLWMWQMRNRNNFIVAPGPSPKKAEWGCWRESGGHMLGTFLPEPAKTYFPWIPDPTTGELKQPERIMHYHHNICMTHPDLPAAYATKVVDAFRAQRDKDSATPMSAIRLGVEDPGADRNYGLCRCERCLRPVQLPDGRVIPVQHATEEGLTFRSTQFYLLLEPIARALEAAFPDARLSTYAYFFAAEPPPFQTRVQPWFCPYAGVPGGQLRQRDNRKPLFSQTNDTWWKYAHGWSRITDLTVLRDYNGLLGNGRPFAEIVAWDLRSLLPMGIRRFTNEIGGSIHDAFVQMDVWVANRLYWEPEADVDALTAYYLRRTFREGAPAMARFFAAVHDYWLVRHTDPEDFVLLGWLIEQSGQREALYENLKDAMATARHPMARANIARLLTTFETWFHLNLEAATANEMIANAKLGNPVPFSSFLHGDRPLPVTYVTFQTDVAQTSQRLFGADDATLPDFTDWTFRLRIRPVGQAADDAFPVPRLSLGSLSPADAATDGPAPWLPSVAAEAQNDGSFLYTVRLRRATGSAFNPATFRTIRLDYAPDAWRDPSGYKPTFAVFDPQLMDTKGGAFVDSTLPQRQGDAPRRRWH